MKKSTLSDEIKQLRAEKSKDFEVVPVALFYKQIPYFTRKNMIGRKFLIVNDKKMTISGLIQILEPPEVYIRQERYNKVYEPASKSDDSPARA